LPALALTGFDFKILPYGEQGAYIIGLDDGIAFMGGSCTVSGPKTFEQSMDAVTALLNKNPEKLMKNMAELYAEAIINAFDCEKNPNAL
jgi:hypothetical protein